MFTDSQVEQTRMQCHRPATSARSLSAVTCPGFTPQKQERRFSQLRCLADKPPHSSPPPANAPFIQVLSSHCGGRLSSETRVCNHWAFHNASLQCASCQILLHLHRGLTSTAASPAAGGATSFHRDQPERPTQQFNAL